MITVTIPSDYLWHSKNVDPDKHDRIGTQHIFETTVKIAIREQLKSDYKSSSIWVKVKDVPTLSIETHGMVIDDDVALYQRIHAIAVSTEIEYIPLTPMSNDEFMTALNNGQKDFRQRLFRYMTIEFRHLQNLDFSGSRLEGCSFEYCNLNNINFSETTSENLTMLNCRVYESCFNCASMNDAEFNLCSIFGGEFDYLNTLKLNAHSCTIVGGSFRFAKLDGADFYATRFTSSNLAAASLVDASFERGCLYNTTLNDADMRNCSLRSTDLPNSHFINTNLIGAVGVYAHFGLWMSSRTDILFGGVYVENGDLVLKLSAGCQHHKTPSQMRDKVQKTHKNNHHLDRYRMAIQSIEDQFALDMKDKKWDYLLSLQ